MMRAKVEGGRNDGDYRPDWLWLETGWVDDERVMLARGAADNDGSSLTERQRRAELFAFFECTAWADQDRWTPAEHRAFWLVAIECWPGRGGRPSNRGRLAHAIRWGRRHGLSR